jgi:hypothetical protein
MKARFCEWSRSLEWICKPWVVGSIPTAGSSFQPIFQWGRVERLFLPKETKEDAKGQTPHPSSSPPSPNRGVLR